MVTPKDFEEQCRQPVAIGTALSMLVMFPIHGVAMFALFTKLNKMFNPSYLAAEARRQKFANRVAPRRA